MTRKSIEAVASIALLILLAGCASDNGNTYAIYDKSGNVTYMLRGATAQFVKSLGSNVIVTDDLGLQVDGRDISADMLAWAGHSIDPGERNIPAGVDADRPPREYTAYEVKEGLLLLYGIVGSDLWDALCTDSSTGITSGFDINGRKHFDGLFEKDGSCPRNIEFIESSKAPDSRYSKKRTENEQNEDLIFSLPRRPTAIESAQDLATLMMLLMKERRDIGDPTYKIRFEWFQDNNGKTPGYPTHKQVKDMGMGDYFDRLAAELGPMMRDNAATLMTGLYKSMKTAITLLPVVGNGAQIVFGFVDIAMGDFAEGGLELATALPFTKYFRAGASKAASKSLHVISCTPGGKEALDLAKKIAAAGNDVAQGATRYLTTATLDLLVKLRTKHLAKKFSKDKEVLDTWDQVRGLWLDGLISPLEMFRVCLVVKCFPAETLVTMADGSRCRFDALKVGDEVMSWDEAAGKAARGRVSEIVTSVGTELTTITFADRQHIRGTPDHPILVNTQQGYRWKPMRSIEPGDHVQTLLNHRAEVVATVTERGPPQTLYNATVDTYHSYCVGDAGVIAHNACFGTLMKAFGMVQQKGELRWQAWIRACMQVRPEVIEQCIKYGDVLSIQQIREYREIIASAIRSGAPGMHEMIPVRFMLDVIIPAAAKLGGDKGTQLLTDMAIFQHFFRLPTDALWFSARGSLEKQGFILKEGKWLKVGHNGGSDGVDAFAGADLSHLFHEEIEAVLKAHMQTYNGRFLLPELRKELRQKLFRTGDNAWFRADANLKQVEKQFDDAFTLAETNMTYGYLE